MKKRFILYFPTISLLALAAVDPARSLQAQRAKDPPVPYQERETVYTNRNGIALGATLTIPDGAGPFPALVLITGMGPQDRDETIGPLKPFVVLADHLARAGFAVLRVDDRGTGKSGGNWMASYTTYCQDVCRGLEYLKEQPEIDRRRLGLLGHSEGGVIGTMVADQNHDVRFLVMLASPGVPAEEFIVRHNESMLRRANVPEEKLKQDLKGVRQLVETLRTTPDPAERKIKLQELISHKPQSAEETEREVGMYCTPWARDYMTSDMTVSFRRLHCPVLAVWGSKDVLVEPEQNAEGLRALIRGMPEARVTVEVMPGMNHLFQKCETGNVEEFFKIKGCLDPALLELVSGWMTKQTQKL